MHPQLITRARLPPYPEAILRTTHTAGNRGWCRCRLPREQTLAVPKEAAMVSLRGGHTQAIALAPAKARHNKVVRVVEHPFDLVVIE